MEILGIGPSEIALIVVLAIIILGPRDMQKAGRTLGRWLRQVVTSDGWKFFQQTSREIQTLPNRLMREAALEELQEMEQGIRHPHKDAREAPGATSTTAAANLPRDPEPRILPSPPAPPAAPATPIQTDPEKNA